MGVTFGDRLFTLDGLSWFMDQKSKIVGELIMNPSTGFMGKKQRMDYFNGGIYRVDENEI